MAVLHLLKNNNAKNTAQIWLIHFEDSRFFNVSAMLMKKLLCLFKNNNAKNTVLIWLTHFWKFIFLKNLCNVDKKSSILIRNCELCSNWKRQSHRQIIKRNKVFYFLALHVTWASCHWHKKANAGAAVETQLIINNASEQSVGLVAEKEGLYANIASSTK